MALRHAAVLPAMWMAWQACAGQGYPLRNAHFKWAVNLSMAPARQYWDGGASTKVEGNTADPHQPLNVMMPVLMSGPESLAQTLDLIPGEYEFSVDAQIEESGRAKLVAGSASMEHGSTGDWQRIALRFTVTDEPSKVTLLCLRGPVRFRAPRVDEVRLAAQPVPVAGGAPIGKIVLPKDPEPAEAYAAWDLQYFLWKMTGNAPGVEGRDPTSAGRTVYIGAAAPEKARAQLKGLKPEGYVVIAHADSLTLAGNTPRGTLYAVYDFLETQGCGWYVPGPLGQVVPCRQALSIAEGVRTESPDWDVRGSLIHPVSWQPGGGWLGVLGEDYLDWAVRNRVNAVWHGTGETHDVGAHRGFSHIQRLNHAWQSFYPSDGPEAWAPLVRGKRVRYNANGLPNMVCTSNRDYRDAVAAAILEYFKENPNAGVAACSADDEPVDWCQCEACRAQDPDGGKGAWELQDSGHPKMAMTDRALHFVNEVAERVSKVYPNRQIEMYAYGSTSLPPTRERVHPNVLIKLCYWHMIPFGTSLRDLSEPGNREFAEKMARWRTAGVKQFGLYDYGGYLCPDATLFWYQPIVDLMKVLHEDWGFRHCIGETDNTSGPSMVAHLLRARGLWDIHIDYRQEIEEICRRFYGPAAEAMIRYHVFMSDHVLHFRPEGGPQFPDAYPVYDGATMERGQALLAEAAAAAGGDERLQKRLAMAQFGHSILALRVAREAIPPTVESVEAANRAHATAMKLWGRNGNGVLSAAPLLGSYKPFPIYRRAPLDQYMAVTGNNTGVKTSSKGDLLAGSAQMVKPARRYLYAAQVFLTGMAEPGSVTLSVLSMPTEGDRTPDNPTCRLLGKATAAVTDRDVNSVLTFDFAAGGKPIDLGDQRLVFLVLAAARPEEGHQASFSFATAAFGRGTYTEPFLWLGEQTGGNGKWTVVNLGLWFYQYGGDS